MNKIIEKPRPRSITCTNAEWENIRKAAKNARQSMTQYLLTCGLSKKKDNSTDEE